jgi:hypothetical protein
MRVYSSSHLGSKKQAQAVEDQYEDLLAFMQILTNLVSRDFVDFDEKGAWHLPKVGDVIMR